MVNFASGVVGQEMAVTGGRFLKAKPPGTGAEYLKVLLLGAVLPVPFLSIAINSHKKINIRKPALTSQNQKTIQ